MLAFWRGPGTVAWLLAVPWALVCGAVALSGARGLWAGSSVEAVVGGIARIDLGIAGVFLLLSRSGIHLRFQEPIVLLTAVHFHYSGFATSTIVLAGLGFAKQSRGLQRPWHVAGLAVTALPLAIALGFVASPVLKAVSAVAFSFAVGALALLLLLESSKFHSQTSRLFIAVGTAFVLVGMALASTYAAGEYLHRTWLTIPRMATTHGWINGLGFVMPVLLGCLAELRSTAETRALGAALQAPAEFALNTQVASPKFTAHDFYDI